MTGVLTNRMPKHLRQSFDSNISGSELNKKSLRNIIIEVEGDLDKTLKAAGNGP